MREPGLDPLARRLDALERQNRRLRRLVVLALAGAALGPVWSAAPRLGQAAGPPPAPTAAPGYVVAAERFVLRDGTGRVGAALGWQDGTPRLTLYDRSGATRAELLVSTDDAPGLALFDADGKARVTLALFVRERARAGGTPVAEAAPALVFYDPTAKVRAALTATPAGAATLDLSDPSGARRATVGVEASGGLAVRLTGANGVDRASLSVLPDDTPALNLYNPEGRARAALAIRGTGGAGLALADKNGQVVWSAP